MDNLGESGHERAAANSGPQHTQPPQSDLPTAQPSDETDYADQAVLGDYLLLEEIGAGGMGQVFKAQHQRMERIVALKILSTSLVNSPELVKRFHREVKGAAKLMHPNIVAAFDAGEQEGTHYLVMEYVDGWPFSDLVERQGPLSFADALNYTLQAARGLQYAHSAGIIHRDVKPNNLMLTGEGVVKILDMGLVRFDTDGDARLTQTGVMMGTVAYMPPEQITDASRADHRADIYSLGCTLYFLLTGQQVYRGGLVDVVVAHATKPIPSLFAAREGVPQQLQNIFERMVAKDPADRYPSMADTIAALEGCQQEPGLAQLADPLQAKTPPPAEVGPRNSVFKGRVSDSNAGGQLHLPVAIRVGTFSSSLAYVNQDLQPQAVENSEGDRSTLTMALVDEGVPTIGEDPTRETSMARMWLDEGSGVTIGKRAFDADSAKQHRLAYFFKSELGKQQQYELGDGSKYHPEVLVALVLRKLVDDARIRIGHFRRLVIAVPACFDDAQRRAMQDAAFIAGCKTVRLVNEPTAAALAWAQRKSLLGSKASSPRKPKILVLSLGADCCDISVVEIANRELRVLASGGDARIGARSWSARLVNSIADRFTAKHGFDPRQDRWAALQLWRRCEGVQRALSTEDRVELSYSFGSQSIRTQISRESFQSATRNLLQTVGSLSAAVLESGQLTWSHIDHALLLGGARMPMVRQLLDKLSQGRLKMSLLEDREIVHGAALYAATLPHSQTQFADVQLQDAAATTLGVVGVDRSTGKRKIGSLIRPNTPLPATVRHAFKVRKDGQRSLQIHLVQGNRDSPEQCTSLGKLNLTDLPPDIAAGSAIEVEFCLTVDGRLEVAFPSSLQMKPSFSRSTGLSAEQLEQWQNWLETMTLCSAL